MKIKLGLIVVATAIFLLAGCSKKVSVRSLVPAEVDRISNSKVIAITSFKHDKVGLASKMLSELMRQNIDNKPVFKVVDRRDISKILREQKLQNSGLVNKNSISELGNLVGTDAIISGEVSKVSSSDEHYYIERIKCVDKECKTKRKYKVKCYKREISLSADIRIMDVALGDTIYAKTVNKASNHRKCSGDRGTIPSSSKQGLVLAQRIADDFVHRLTPHYVYTKVELLEDEDIDYSDKEEKLLKNSIKFIEIKRYDKADKMLRELIELTSQKSYVALYNLGVVKEIIGDYEKAEKYYKMADNLTVEPNIVVGGAYLRIKNSIANREEAKGQLNR